MHEGVGGLEASFSFDEEVYTRVFLMSRREDMYIGMYMYTLYYTGCSTFSYLAEDT